MSESKKDVFMEGVVAVLKSKTPSVAVGIAVVLAVVFVFYPRFSKEVSQYLDYRKEQVKIELMLEKDKALFEKESRDASLKALAEITANHSKELITQAKEIGTLKGEVAGLKRELTECRRQLQACELTCSGAE
jgi:hypothetical protein